MILVVFIAYHAGIKTLFESVNDHFISCLSFFLHLINSNLYVEWADKTMVTRFSGSFLSSDMFYSPAIAWFQGCRIKEIEMYIYGFLSFSGVYSSSWNFSRNGYEKRAWKILLWACLNKSYPPRKYNRRRFLSKSLLEVFDCFSNLGWY